MQEKKWVQELESFNIKIPYLKKGYYVENVLVYVLVQNYWNLIKKTFGHYHKSVRTDNKSRHLQLPTGKKPKSKKLSAKQKYPVEHKWFSEIISTSDKHVFFNQFRFT